jgi:hypothetical protein
MVRKKRGILRRETILVNGKEIEVDTFDAKVIVGSGEELAVSRKWWKNRPAYPTL